MTDPERPEMDEFNRYRVSVAYQEPTYRAARGAPAGEPYTWVFHVRAGSKTEASERARAAFREWARRSSVGWVREIVSVTAERVDQR